MSYVIAGKKILNEHIALGVFGLTGAIAYAATRGGSKETAKVVPEIAASSDDEATFIKDFIAKLEKEDTAGAKH